MASPSIILCFFMFSLGDNINFVSINGTDSADGLSPSTAKSLRSTLLLSLSSFQKVYILPGMYTEAKNVSISHSIEVVGSIRSGVSYALSNTSVDPESVDVSYDIDDIETVINNQVKIDYMILDNYTGLTAQVRRIRFVGKSYSNVFGIRNAELTTRMCYFAGNCSCFAFIKGNGNSKLSVKWCVFQPNSWNSMSSVIFSDYKAKSLVMEDCFVKNVKERNTVGVVVSALSDSDQSVETVTIRNCDFRGCQGGVLYFYYVKTITISNCSLCDHESFGYASMLYLDGPPPSGFSLRIEDVAMQNNTNQSVSQVGGLFFAGDFDVSPFSAESVVNVTYYPIGLNLVGSIDLDEIAYDQTFLINSGDGVEVSFTGLSDGVSSLPDFIVYDSLSNYIAVPECESPSEGCVDGGGEDEKKDGGDGDSVGILANIIIRVVIPVVVFVLVMVLLFCWLFCWLHRQDNEKKASSMRSSSSSWTSSTSSSSASASASPSSSSSLSSLSSSSSSPSSSSSSSSSSPSSSSSSSSSNELFSEGNDVSSSSSVPHSATPGNEPAPVPGVEMKRILDGAPSPSPVSIGEDTSPQRPTTQIDIEVTGFIEMTATVNKNPASFTAADFRREFQETVGRKATPGEVTLFLKVQQQQVASAGAAPNPLPPYAYGSVPPSSYPPPQPPVFNSSIYPQYPTDGD